MKIHELKTDSDVFYAVMNGEKTYELRKNDRDFEYGDILILRRVTTEEDQKQSVIMPGGEGETPLFYTGDYFICQVAHILVGPIYGLAEGWVLLSLKKSYQQGFYAKDLS